MNNIKRFLNLYLNRKLRIESIIFILNISIILTIYLTFLILIEKTAFLTPEIKTKNLNIILIISGISFTFLILKIIIHKYNFWNNSNDQKLAKELIHKISTKDSIINALQIYSELDIKNPYSDLTIKAIDDAENQIDFSEIKKIKMTFPIKNFYLLCIIIISFITLISISNEYYNAAYRMTHYNIFWNKPLPFNLSIQGKTNKTVIRNDMLKINLDGL